MYEWQKQIQVIVDEIDNCIKHYNDEALTLRFLSQRLGYSEIGRASCRERVSSPV